MDDARAPAAYMGASMSESREDRIKRLSYRAGRRGFKEADLVIGGFARAHLPELSDERLDEFEDLLNAPDPDIYSWATGRSAPPAQHDNGVVDALRQFVRDGGAAG